MKWRVTDCFPVAIKKHSPNSIVLRHFVAAHFLGIGYADCIITHKIKLALEDHHLGSALEIILYLGGNHTFDVYRNDK